jgi:predicted Zn-dependent protease
MMKNALMICAALAGCAPIYTAGPTPVPAPQTASNLAPEIAARNFIAVVRQIEPLAETVCREAGTQRNCDFQIVIDDRPNQPVNAFQTLDGAGRPILAFTLPLIGSAQNRDELAFIMGHEAAHHIAGHIAQTQRTATAGAVLAGVLASASGLDQAGIDRAAQIGGNMASRAYSKDFELQADLIGTRIAVAAGYDPILGAAFFDRLPDPGDRFLGTHPANAARKAVVAREAARLRGQ